MAEEDINFTDDELNQIQDLLQPLEEDPRGSVFRPMKETFEQDLEELKPPPAEEDEFPDITGPLPDELPPIDVSGDVPDVGGDFDFGAADTPLDVPTDTPAADAPAGDDFNLDDFVSDSADTPSAPVADAGDAFDPSMLDAGLPDTDLPDAGLPDAGIPDATIPDAGIADSLDFGTPDATLPDDAPATGDDLGLDFGFDQPTDADPLAGSDPITAEPTPGDTGDLNLDDLMGGDTPADAPITDLGLDDFGGTDAGTDDAGIPDLGLDQPADTGTADTGIDDFNLDDFATDASTPDLDTQDIAGGGDVGDTADATPPGDGLGDFNLGLDDVGADSPPAGDDLDLDLGLDSVPDSAPADGGDDFDLDLGLGGDTSTADLPATEAVPAGDADALAGGDALTDDFNLGPDSLTPDVSDGGGGDFDLNLDDLSDTGGTDLSGGGGDFDLGGDGLDLDSAPAGDTGGGGDFDLDSGSELDFSDFDGLEDAAAPTDAAADTGALDASGLDAGGLDSGGLDSGGLDTSMDDLSADMLDASDLADMADKAKLDTGIGDEFTDEQLAAIRTNLSDYPPGIKKSVIDVIVNEKVSQPEQRLLVNMVMDQAEPDQVADFIQERLGYRPDTTPPQTTKEGVPIIYADGMSPEELAQKRRRAKIMGLVGLVGIIAVALVGAGMWWANKMTIDGIYEDGLKVLATPGVCSNGTTTAKGKTAEAKFQEALDKRNGVYETKYLNRYGIAYLKAGCYEDAFVKLFGDVTPAFGKGPAGRDDPLSAWNRAGRRAPLIRFARGASWPAAKKAPGGGYIAEGNGARFVSRDRKTRVVKTAGAYIVERLRDSKNSRPTLMNLARFHSYKARDFLESPSGKKFKNDGLAIDYYRLILTLLNKPNDIEAIAGIGNIYYDRKEFAAAARQFNRIIDKNPMEIAGHEGLLNTYIEMWKKKKDDPRWVIARHRLIQNLGLEKKLDIYVMTKLAGFYIELDEDDLRIKYQVDPVDQLSGLSIKDNTIRLLELIFRKESKRDETVITGSRYGEAFYQRGRYLMARKEAARALKQFQNAHQYDKHHYLAVNAMGEYYKEQMDFVKARAYFKRALEIYERDYKNYGGRPEDEPLQEGDIGKIHYNLGSLIFLRNAGVADPRSGGFPDTRIYPSRSLDIEPEKLRRRRELLGLAAQDLEKALKTNVRDFRARIESIYWLGWIDYVNTRGNDGFQEALRRWEQLDALYDYTYSDPVLLMAKGNAYYYTKQYRAALGNYLKVKSEYERRALAVDTPDAENKEHQKLFLTLSAVYNNIGAVYEMEYIEQLANSGSRETLDRLEKNALLHYWKSIDAARKVQYDNEIPRTNQQLGFKSLNRVSSNRAPREPLIDDWISPILPSLKKK